MRRVITAALVMVLAASSAAISSVWISADDYLSLRRQSNALRGQAAACAKSDPTSYEGKVIELQGTVSGVAQRAQCSTFVVTSGSQSYIVATSDPNPQVEPGAVVRMLTKASPTSDFTLVAATWDYQITQREKAAMVKMQKPKPARVRTPLTSRGSYARQDALAAKWMDVIEPYRRAIRKFNPRLSVGQAEAIACWILEYSQKYDVDPRLVVAVVLAESHFRLDATSRCGAMGLGQLMPGTAAGLGVSNAYDPHQNLAGAVRLIRGHLDKLSGGRKWSQLTWQHLALALASYNAGPGAVRKYGGVPPYRETQNYIARVTQYYRQLCGFR